MADALRRGIDRKNLLALVASRLSFAPEQRELARLELPPVKEANGSGEEKFIVVLNHPIEVRLTHPGAFDRARVVADNRLEDPESLARRQHTLRGDQPDYGGIHPRFELTDRLDGRSVFVAVRNVVQHIARGE